MRRAFETFDIDKSGFIELEEMTRILQDIGNDTMTDAEIKEVFNEFDVNGDGRLDYNGNFRACIPYNIYFTFQTYVARLFNMTMIRRVTKLSFFFQRLF